MVVGIIGKMWKRIFPGDDYQKKQALSAGSYHNYSMKIDLNITEMGEFGPMSRIRAFYC